MPRSDTKVAWYFLSRSLDGLKIILNLKRSPLDGRSIGSNIVSSVSSCGSSKCTSDGQEMRKKVSREFRKRKDKVNLENAKETIERMSMIAEGLRQFAAYRVVNVDFTRTGPVKDMKMVVENVVSTLTSPHSPLSQIVNKLPKNIPLDNLPGQVNEILKNPFEVGRNLSSLLRPKNQLTDEDMGVLLPPIDTSFKVDDKWPDLPTEPASAALPKEDTSTVGIQQDVQVPPTLEPPSVVPPPLPPSAAAPATKEKTEALKVKPKEKKLRELSSNSKAKKVPSTRLGRVASFGQLAAGLGLGAITEASKRSLGFGGAKTNADGSPDYSAFLSEANLNRIVDTLCKVRGAALKLGQIISIQDDSIVSPQIAAAFERVRQSADFMPSYQMNRAMKAEFGSNWREKFVTFNEKPFAAASIGQVHEATIRKSDLNVSNINPGEQVEGDDDVIEVAVKIQYPGVADGMDSDIKNLVTIMKFWKMVPDGMFLDQVARKELFAEVDYKLEAESQLKYRSFMEKYKDVERINVPMVYPNVSTGKVLITELINGVPIDKLFKSDVVTQEKKNDIAERLLKLTLREVFEFKFMQTDPNFSNYLYDVDTDTIHLLDFGAAREYSKDFTDKYFMIIKGAAEQDYDTILKYSIELGFLSGFEAKVMTDAHVEAVMILGEAFADKYYASTGSRVFDFSNQNTTRRISSLVPVMLKHRLTPPPEETYSLHRKMSGMFLLCAKLNAKIDCRKIYLDICKNYDVNQV